MSRARLQLVILAVADVPRSVAFYTAAFGWTPSVDLPVYAELRLPGGTGVSLYARAGFAVNTGQPSEVCPPGALTATELYVSVDDLDDAIARLRAAGARELAPAAPRAWGDTAAYFADPDGNVVAVALPTPGGDHA